MKICVCLPYFPNVGDLDKGKEGTRSWVIVGFSSGDLPGSLNRDLAWLDHGNSSVYSAIINLLHIFSIKPRKACLRAVVCTVGCGCVYHTNPDLPPE